MAAHEPRRSSPAQKSAGWLGALLLLAGAALAALPSSAQVQNFMLSPGNRGKVGPSTEVKPENCVTAPDGAITCDTKLVNPPGNTPAQPSYSPFSN